MKIRHYLQVLLLMCIVTFMYSCSTSSDDLEINESNAYISQEIKTTFDETTFLSNLDNVSAMFSGRNRVAVFDEEQAEAIIHPFIVDGINIKRQLLDDITLTREETEKIQSLTNNELAVLSVVAYAIITTANADVELMETSGEYQRATNKRLHCISEALAGGSAITGSITWGFIWKMGTKTAIRLAASSLGGMVGGAITVAIFLNDYNDCMNKQ